MAKYIDAERYINNLRELQTGDKDTVYEYYDDGIEVAISEAATFPAVDIPRWIPVTERLPEKEGQYLVSCDTDYGVEVGRFYIDEDGERYFGCDWNDPDDINAWMPLPKPYKRGKQND